MLMLLCVDVTRVLFLVLAGNFALWASIGVNTLTLVAYSYSLLHDVVSPQYMQHAGGVAHEGLYQTKNLGRAVLTHEVRRGVATR